MVLDMMERKHAVQRELKRRGISQKQIAAKAGVSESALSEILGGTYSVATEEGRKTRHRVLRIVARFIERTDLFPELEAA